MSSLYPEHLVDAQDTLTNSENFTASSHTDLIEKRRRDIIESIYLLEDAIEASELSYPTAPLHRRVLVPDRSRISWRAEAEGDISTMRATILGLKSQYNDLASISRFPPKLLSRVFLLCTICEDDTFLQHRRSLTWIDISHVCRRWAAISLRIPLLWSTIIVKYPWWTIESLARSRGSPLALRVNFHTLNREGRQAVRLVLTEISRIAELVIAVRDLRNIGNAFTWPAPVLHTFHLRCTESSSNTGIRHLPSIPFAGVAPALRLFRLEHCTFVLDARLFQKLTDLNLVKVGMRQSMSSLIDALEGMPTLRNLQLHDSFPVNHDFDVAEGLRATLPLSHLSLDGPQIFCTNLLNHICIPSIPISNFQIRLQPIIDDNIVRFILAILRCGRKDDIRKPLFASWKTTNLGVRFQSGTEAELLTPITASAVRVWLNFSTSYEYNNLIVEAVDAMVSVAPSSQVEVLCVSNLHFRAGWLDAALRLSGVETLQLDGEPVYGFIAALEAQVEEEPDVEKPPKRTFFPYLSALLLWNAPTWLDSRLEVLLHWLAVRKKQGLQIRLLQIHQCANFRQGDASRIKRVVEEVIWNGLSI